MGACDADEGGVGGRREAGCDETAQQILTAQVSCRLAYHHTSRIDHSITSPSISREVPELVNSLSWVLDSPAKMVLFHHICQLLPENAQVDFDRIAAAMLAGGKGLKCCTCNIFIFAVYTEPAINRAAGVAPLEGEFAVRSRLSSSSSSSSSHAGGSDMAAASRVVGGAPTPTRREVGGGAKRNDDVPIKIPKEEVTPAKPVLRHLVTSTPILGHSIPAQDSSAMSTPGGVPLPPNPPPTPIGGVGGVPVPPPPPPALPGAQQGHLKRVNWEKLYGTEGTVWKEVTACADTF